MDNIDVIEILFKNINSSPSDPDCDWKDICMKVMDAVHKNEGVIFDELWELPEETKDYVIREWEKKNGFDT